MADECEIEKLTDAELLKLEAIRQNRKRGWLPTVEECDFMLELIGRWV